MLKLDQFSRPAIYLLAAGLMTIIGAANYVSSVEISFSIFYLLPIALVGWSIGRRDGIFAALVGAVLWFLADSRRVYSHPLFPYWNAAVRLFFFLIVVYILTELKRALEREQSLSRVDFLTGIFNSKAFYELAEREIERSRRSELPLTLAYIDCDDFKNINDRLGHETGDRLLKVVAETLRRNIRGADLGARIGGDEFIVLLPETNEEAAQVILERLRQMLDTAMDEKGWSVTFSIGAATFQPPLDSMETMIRKADDLMYTAKNSGKNRMLRQAYPSP
jgi:diguanylate cyclase (GGDEF)-like protein